LSTINSILLKILKKFLTIYFGHSINCSVKKLTKEAGFTRDACAAVHE
jgi:hypothetical protein